MQKFILASASPRRRELLSKAGFSFEIQTSDAEENENPRGNPREMVLENALAKARAVAEKNPDALVLGADTTVALGGCVLNKPADLCEARKMLRALGGNAHTVFTGVALVCAGTGFCETRVVTCRVKFKPLSDEMISRYFEICNPLDKAGAYGIQGGAALFVSGISGDYYNIMGLPVCRLGEILRQIAPEIMEDL